ncbi:MAG: VOC family protein [Desulfofustis sp.]|jgi:predicted enzyme related to lactoylglutathione lyase|nr:VOC family protein [Desulfofustis sp.]
MRNNVLSGLVFFAAAGVAVLPFISGCSHVRGLPEGAEELAGIPITDHPSGLRFPGMVIWHDLLTPDLAKAAGFYENLFGWQIEYLEHAAVVRHHGERIAGIVEVQPTGRGARGIWIPSVSVGDVDAAVDLVEASGGRQLKGPVEMEGRGRAALIRDFQGADMVVLTARGGDPVKSEAAVGAWLWDEVWTADPDKTGAFYQNVLGYDDILPVNEGYGIFLHEGAWMAGIRHLQRDRYDPLWVPVVRVVDPAATANRVEALGGEVLISPEAAPGDGNVSLIADPTGTMLLIQRWPSP